MKLIYKETGKEVKVGDTAKTFRGEEVEVVSFDLPHKPSSSGKILIQNRKWKEECYVSVIGAEWIEREDRQ